MVDAFNTPGDNTQNDSCVSVFLSYLGLAFHEFWARCGDDLIHPADKPFFEADQQLEGEKIGRFQRKTAKFQTENFPPCPFDGAIGTAKLVLCLANPNYDGFEETEVRAVVSQQRSGLVGLPREWDDFYSEKLASPLGLEMDQIRAVTAILNLCPYASSPYMQAEELRLAAGLPSVWQAQRYLREVLIPKACKDEIYIVITRKHQAWGVHEGFECKNIVVSRQNPIAGRIPTDRGMEIRNWLQRKGHITNQTRCES